MSTDDQIKQWREMAESNETTKLDFADALLQACDEIERLQGGYYGKLAAQAMLERDELRKQLAEHEKCAEQWQANADLMTDRACELLEQNRNWRDLVEAIRKEANITMGPPGGPNYLEIDEWIGAALEAWREP